VKQPVQGVHVKWILINLEKTRDYAYTIWGRPNCIWCQRAKEFLTDVGEPFDYIELTPTNLGAFQEITYGAKTVPQVFDPVGGLIGGYEDLVEFYRTRVEAEVNLA
jgi:glutaredoxin